MVEIKVCTYNIHSCVGTDGLYSIDRVANVLRDGDADIVCLQEVEVNDTSNFLQTRVWSCVHGDDQPAMIAKLAGYRYHAFAPAIRSRASSRCNERHSFVLDEDVVSGHFADELECMTEQPLFSKGSGEQLHLHHYIENNDMGKFGISILSKYPIIQIKTHHYQRYKRKTLRNAMACLVALPDNTLIWIVNTHLGCHFIGKEQYQQAKELVNFIRSLEISNRNNCTGNPNRKIGGVILCGDFNSPPIFSCIRFMNAYGLLRDVWCQDIDKGKKKKEKHWASGLGGGTFPSHARVLRIPSCLGKFPMIRMRLDYIFVLCQRGEKKEIDCKCVYVQDDSGDCALASDHLPLCAVFFVG